MNTSVSLKSWVLEINTKKSLFLSVAISCFLSACSTSSPAPVESSSIYSKNSPSSESLDNTGLTSTREMSNGENSRLTKLKRLKNFNGYICEDAPVYIGQSIGDGECVDLVKLCSNAPLTRYWKPGKHVFGTDIPPGTAIATFRRGKYPNRTGYHAAIYSHQDKNGIYAWDQWRGQPVHLRYIKAKQSHKNAGNNASKYRIIRK